MIPVIAGRTLRNLQLAETGLKRGVLCIREEETSKLVCNQTPCPPERVQSGRVQWALLVQLSCPVPASSAGSPPAPLPPSNTYPYFRIAPP